MELTFSELRTKEVVNVEDGRKLGKAIDIVFCYPENRWLGIIVPNGKAFCSKKGGLLIEVRQIVKIGDDVILVNVGASKKGNGKCEPSCPPPPPPHPMPPAGGRRTFEEYE